MKTVMRTRNDFPALLREIGLTGDAIEIGCAEGCNAFHILENWPGRFFMVDPWRILTTPGFSPHGEATDADQEARYQRVLDAAMRYNKPGQKPRCVPMRMTSEVAVKTFGDGFFDFVYLDANHIYDEVKKDIAIWALKVKSGGILAGHDFLDGVVGGVDYGVQRAVQEFCAENHKSLMLTKETEYPSWWLVK